MAISLSKGGNVSLSKEDPSLTSLHVGLGWDPRKTDGVAFDLDAACFMLDSTGKAHDEGAFIFYGNLASPCKSVVHQGDNRTGAGDGDDEVLMINLGAVPANIEKLSFVVSIHEAKTRSQNFGMVDSAFIRMVNAETNVEIARFDLSEDASTNTAIVFGEVYRHNGEWKFKAVAQGFDDGLNAVVAHYGLSATA